MAKGIFITATDTGVGKTITASTIIRALKGQGIKVGAMKPIETGCMRRDGVLVPSDGWFLKGISGMDDSLRSDHAGPFRTTPGAAYSFSARGDCSGTREGLRCLPGTLIEV